MVTLVTGATGLLGNNVTRALLAEGRRVRVLTRHTADPRPLAGLDVEIVRGDVRDSAAVAQAVRGATAVVHAAGHVHIGWTGLATARAINVDGTRIIASAALAEGARLVHVSSLDALAAADGARPTDEDHEPSEDRGVLCPYVVTKRESERIVLDMVDQGLDARIVNPGYLIGPYDWKPSSGRMLIQVAKWRGVWAPLGANQFCDPRDVSSGILAALERGAAGRRYILGGHWQSYFQAWRLFAAVSGGLPPVFPVGPLIRKGAGCVGDCWARLTGREPDVNSASVAMASQPRNFTSNRAKIELGYLPRPLAESASDAWQWFRANGYV